MDVRELLRTRLLQLDPTIDTTDGSYADRVLITPVTDALGSDLLSVDVRDFLTEKYAEAFPSSPIARGDAISDILISAAEVFLSGYRQQLSLLRNAQSISRIDLLSDADADALAANWLVSRALGATASGAVTVVVDRPSAIALDPITTKFSTAAGVQFAPVASRVITAEQLQSGRVGVDRFAFDVEVAAIVDGTGGNIVAGEIRTSTGIGNVVSVTNKAAFVGGVTGDTTRGLLSTKLPRAISERSLVTARGIVARLATSYQNIAAIQVIGLDDPEMTRDAVTAESFASVEFTGIARIIGRSALLSCIRVGVTADVTEEMRVTLRSAAGVTSTHRVIRVIDQVPTSAPLSLIRAADIDTWVQLDGEPAAGLHYVTVLSVQRAILGGRHVDDRVHLGGRADIYVRPRDERPIELPLLLSAYLGDSLYGRGVRTSTGRAVDLTTFQSAPAELRRCVLLINGGTYDVLYAERVAPTTLRVFIDGQSLPTTDPAVSWHIARTFGVDVSSSRAAVFPRTPNQSLVARGLLGSPFLTVETNQPAELAFSGVQNGDTITLESDRSEFTVVRVEGLRVYVRGQVPRSIAPTPASITRSQGATPSPIGVIDRLLVDDVAMPYRSPLGLRVRALSAEGAQRFAQVGFVAPSLYYAMRALYVSSPTVSHGNILLDQSIAAYEIVSVRAAEDVLAPPTVLPRAVLHNSATLRYSRTNSPPPAGTSVVLALSNRAEIEDDALVNANAHELLLWNELLSPGTRNIFMVPELAQYGEIFNAHESVIRAGDVLRLHEGPNAGSYLIADVIFVELNMLSDGDVSEATTLVSEPGNVGRRAVMRAGSTQSRKIACIKIFGEFPVQEHEHAEPDLRVSAGKPNVSFEAGGAVITPLDLRSIGNALLGQFRTSASSRDLAAAATDLFAAAPFNAVPSTDTKITSGVYTAQRHAFSIVAAARGNGELVTERNDTCTASSALPSLVPTAVALRGLRSEQPPAPYRVPTSSIASWGGTQLIVSSDAGFLYTEPRYGVTPALFREFTPINTYSHDRMALADLVSPDVITLDVDADELRGPADLVVHEEIYLSGLARLRDESLTVRFAPVLLTDYDVTGAPERVTVMVNGAPVDVTLAHSTTLRVTYAAQLSWTNSAGISLGDVLSRYAVFLITDTGFPIDVLTPLQDYAALSAGTDDLSVRLISQPEVVYRHVFAESDITRPVMPLAVVGPSDYDIRVLPQMPVAPVSLPMVPVGSIVRLTHRGTTYDRRVVAVSGDIIRVDAPILTRDAELLAYGVCDIDLTTGKIQLGAAPDFAISGDSFSLTTPGADSTALYQGGASRPLTSADANRTQLTLWGVTESYHTLAAADVENPRADAFYPIRRHLGTATVTRVTSVTAVSPTSGAQYVASQEIQCSATPWLNADISTLSELREGDRLRCYFALTSDVIALPEVGGGVDALSTIQVFEETPETYHIAASSLDGDGAHALVARRGDTRGASADSASSVFRYIDVDGLPILASYDKNNPYNIRVGRVRGALALSALTVQRSPVDATLPITSAGGDGFEIVSPDRDAARSTRERLFVTTRAARGALIGRPISLRARYSPAVAQAQALAASALDRAVCSDMLVRRMATGYIGLSLRYEGGPQESVMASRIRDVIENAISQGVGLGVADIVALAVNLGALRVETPIEMYVCVEDMSRVRHRREIANVLDAAQLLHVDATHRITSIEAAPSDSALLGAQISVTRVITNSSQLGSGGA